MPLREFRDSSGIEWKVWDTTPDRMHASPASERGLGDLRGGWITFSSILGRRRLAPVPAGWADLAAAELERLCGQAVPTRRQSGEVDTPTGDLEAVKPGSPRSRATEKTALVRRRLPLDSGAGYHSMCFPVQTRLVRG